MLISPFVIQLNWYLKGEFDMVEEIKRQRETIEEYQYFMEELAIDIIPVSDKVGLVISVPLPFDVDPQHFIEVCSRAMTRATELSLDHLVVDVSRLTAVRMVQNIGAFKSVIQGFRLIGISVVLSGITPQAALATVKAGVDFTDVPTYSRLSDALKSLNVT
jgi:rsbT co-antagonist protein RsbR